MIETNNLYYASYLFNEGLNIANVEKRNDTRLGDTVVFIFTADNKDLEDRIERAFQEGTALTNVCGYLDSLTKVRDIMYGFMNTSSKNNNTKNTSLKNQRGAKDEYAKCKQRTSGPKSFGQRVFEDTRKHRCNPPVESYR